MSSRFQELGISERIILDNLKNLSFHEPSAIQLKTIPLVLEGKSVIGQAQTGTGKTAAFSLPIINKLLTSERSLKDLYNNVLIISPTRELAMQIEVAIKQFTKNTAIRSTVIYGGVGYDKQRTAIKAGCHIIVATPGRLLDLADAHKLDLSHIDTLVLDEADQMLNMGFMPDIKKILAKVPTTSQKLLFSATMPASIRSICNTYFPNTVKVEITPSLATKTIDQHYLPISRGRSEALHTIIEKDADKFTSAIVFVSTKMETVLVASKLSKLGYKASSLNGDMAQKQREIVVDSFRKSLINIIVATDVAARGIDISHVSHVFQFGIPMNISSYMHRIGRTGRMGKTGDAYLFVDTSEVGFIKRIEKSFKITIERFKFPSQEEIVETRKASFVRKVSLACKEIDSRYKDLVEHLSSELQDIDIRDILASVIAISSEGKRIFASVPRLHEETNSRRSSSLSYILPIGKIKRVTPADIILSFEKAGIKKFHIGSISIDQNRTRIEMLKSFPPRFAYLIRKVRVQGVNIS